MLSITEVIASCSSGMASYGSYLALGRPSMADLFAPGTWRDTGRFSAALGLLGWRQEFSTAASNGSSITSMRCERPDVQVVLTDVDAVIQVCRPVSSHDSSVHNVSGDGLSECLQRAPKYITLRGARLSWPTYKHTSRALLE